jgi:hypothetical protein
MTMQGGCGGLGGRILCPTATDIPSTVCSSSPAWGGRQRARGLTGTKYEEEEAEEEDEEEEEDLITERIVRPGAAWALSRGCKKDEVESDRQLKPNDAECDCIGNNSCCSHLCYCSPDERT